MKATGSKVSTNRPNRRLPRSLRKYLRNEKARLRRQLPAEEARRAVEQLLRGLRRAGAPPTDAPTTDTQRTEKTQNSRRAREEEAS
jgi:hypothetical protein